MRREARRRSYRAGQVWRDSVSLVAGGILNLDTRSVNERITGSEFSNLASVGVGLFVAGIGAGLAVSASVAAYVARPAHHDE